MLILQTTSPVISWMVQPPINIHDEWIGHIGMNRFSLEQKRAFDDDSRYIILVGEDGVGWSFLLKHTGYYEACLADQPGDHPKLRHVKIKVHA